MNVPRISASSYSNTAPLIWSFLYGSMRGHVEIILDNAPARSAELLAQGRVDAALVPVIAYQSLPDVRLVSGVCVGAKEKVRSVALITRGMDLQDVRSVSLDTSSRTSVVLSKILFREFLGFDPEWRDSAPNIQAMLDESDCALLIGDPALSIANCGSRIAELNPKSKIQNLKSYDLAELWRQHTGLGFIFAMWMTRAVKSPLDFAAARDEGVERIDEIVSNYLADIKISEEDFRAYLSSNISYKIDEELERGMRLYFDLAKKHRLCENVRELEYAR
jgi:chorismate dehydratase